MKVALNEKRKNLCGFSFSINIVNFEAFLLVFKLTKNLFFLKSDKAISFQFRAKESKPSNKSDCYLGLAHLKIPLGSGKPESGRGNSKNNPFGQKGLVI